MNSWQTPSVEDAGRKGSAKGWLEYLEDGRTTQCRLRNQVQWEETVKNWPTPNADMDMQERMQNIEWNGENLHSATLPKMVEAGLSPEASPAKTSALLVRERESGEAGLVFGLSIGELLGRYDPATQSWRTSVRSLFEDLIECLGRLPRSGMTRSGKIYEQKTWVLRTGEKGSGSWPTPTQRDWKDTGDLEKLAVHEPKKRLALTVAAEAVKCPTPRGQMTRNGTGKEGRGKCNLEEVLGGQLNPTWVDWLMGYPVGWTDLGDSETQLSLR